MLGDLVSSVRGTHAAVAVAEVLGTEATVTVDPGADPVDESTLFEVGSITKTMTATLLATMVVDGTLSLDTTVGEVLANAGGATALTLLQLATHTSGLPRLAPNHQELSDPADPYAYFDVGALADALTRVSPQPTEAPEYSNFGFQLLGHVLAMAAGGDFDTLVIDRVLTPAGCQRPRCGAAEGDDDLIPGYEGNRQVPRWRQPLGGAGAVLLSLTDLAQWVVANVEPASTPIGDALRLAQEPHWGDTRNGRGLGWILYGNGRIHNGGTGGFHCFCGFVPGRFGVAIMVNLANWDVIDGVAIRHLTAMLTS